jgi:hypothetical protein
MLLSTNDIHRIERQNDGKAYPEICPDYLKIGSWLGFLV